jgi:hypothetical protein
MFARFIRTHRQQQLDEILSIKSKDKFVAREEGIKDIGAGASVRSVQRDTGTSARSENNATEQRRTRVRRHRSRNACQVRAKQQRI